MAVAIATTLTTRVDVLRAGDLLYPCALITFNLGRYLVIAENVFGYRVKADGSEPTIGAGASIG